MAAEKQRHAVWFRDAEGNEDHLTVLADEMEAGKLEDHFQELKEKGNIAEFVVILDSPYSLAEALAYITEKLEGVTA